MHMGTRPRRSIQILAAGLLAAVTLTIASGIASAQSSDELLSPSAVYEQVNPAVVTIRVRSEARNESGSPGLQGGTAAGFILDTDGHIVTALHVVYGADRIDVILADGSTYRAEVLGTDPGNDLAIVTLQAPPEKLQGLATARLGDSSGLRVGETVIAIGSPFGLDRTLTMGVISSLGRMRSGVGERLITDMIQVDAPINPGNSGGPLLNLRGEVIGINEQIEGTGSTGIGFAVPVNTLTRHLPDLLTSREPRHAWLGISGRALSPAGAETLEMAGQRGVVLGSVAPGGPAALAGLLGSDETGSVGDVIVELDDHPVRSVEEIAQYIDRKEPGDTVRVTYIRDGHMVTAVATLGAWVSPLPPSR
jgi:S1-C subfamily serine protease